MVLLGHTEQFFELFGSKVTLLYKLRHHAEAVAEELAHDIAEHSAAVGRAWKGGVEEVEAFAYLGSSHAAFLLEEADKGRYGVEVGLGFGDVLYDGAYGARAIFPEQCHYFFFFLGKVYVFNRIHEYEFFSDAKLRRIFCTAKYYTKKIVPLNNSYNESPTFHAIIKFDKIHTDGWCLCRAGYVPEAINSLPRSILSEIGQERERKFVC